MDKNSFDQDLAERITLNAVLASRVYLKDTKRFKENLLCRSCQSHKWTSAR